MAKHPLSPKAYLKARRPERFSDSFVDEGPRLDRSAVEYHLETLTSRSQEFKFQEFARHLLQREVCPNLLPQSGPTGGGDSKVDSETYPVSDDLSLVWFVGDGRDAARERWAFAFSAKQDWRAKLRSDIAKIADTGREYAKAFFVTNQYVSDKKRSTLEDSLSKEHGLDVRVLDRTWILDRVFEAGHEDLVVSDLELQCELRTTVQQGPRDEGRQSELDELEESIKASAEEGRQDRNLVDNCIEAVILSRALEHPRERVDGLLARMHRVSRKCGTAHQRLVATYQHAWTAFWYFEDFDEFVSQYQELETQACGSNNIYHLELLFNSWHPLRLLCEQNHVEEEAFRDHTAKIVAELERFESCESRPSAALQAESFRHFIELLRIDPKEPDEVFRGLKAVVERCDHVIGFPLAVIVEIVSNIGGAYCESDAFEELFRTVEAAWERRAGDLASARLQLSRGAQLLDGDRSLQAIRTIGRALTKLFKEESRDELVRALYLCACAYERIGLLWAARGALVTAASIAVHEFWHFEEITRLQAACFNRVKWIELQLGRVPQTLEWHEVDFGARSALASKGEDLSTLEEGDLAFDAILGMQFLRLDVWDLKEVTKLPSTLESLGLDGASLALRFALGDEEGVAADLQQGAEEGGALQEIFVRWRDQPAGEDLRAEPALGHQQTIELVTSVAGCDVSTKCQNVQHCTAVAESLMASLESLLSTSFEDRVLARQPSLRVSVKHSDFGEEPIAFEMVEKRGVLECQIRCTSFDPNQMVPDTLAGAKRRLLEALSTIICRCFYVADHEALLERMFGDEQAVDRAMHFTSSFVVLGNVLGHSPRCSIADWIQDDAVECRLVRGEKWDTGCEPCVDEFEGAPLIASAEEREAQGLPNPNQIKHSQMKSVSLIRESLWNRAGWSATAMAVYEDPRVPPLLLPAFKDESAAQEIFEGLREDVGEEDSDDQLRVVLIRGICRSNPYAYRVVFGTQPTRPKKLPQKGFVAFNARVNTMEARSSENLDRFLKSYEMVGKYAIAPCAFESEVRVKEPMLSLAIKKWHLNIREAWEIGPNDLDGIGIRPDDDPVVPPGESNPPVFALLDRDASR